MNAKEIRMYKKLTRRTDDRGEFILGDEVRAFVEKVCEEININDMLAKATSSSFKYHPTLCNRAGDGLMHHKMIALITSDSVVKLMEHKLSKEDRDCITAAIILHDAWKYYTMGFKKSKYTTREHGLVGYAVLMKMYEADPNKREFIKKIATAVRYHMSNWCHPKTEIEAATKMPPLTARIVQICDIISSNKELMEYTAKHG